MKLLSSQTRSASRRDFIQRGIFGTLAAAVAPAAIDPAKVLNYNSGMRYRQLGNTGLSVSLISMGGLVMVEPVYHYAIERGMNFVDTSPSYRGGLAIKQLGNVLRTRRDKVYVACKYHSYVRFEENLRDLKTDYVDFIVFNHHDRGSAREENDLEVFEKFKKAGKARLAALMTHGDVKEVTAIGIRKGMYCFVAPSLSQPGLELLQPEIRSARQKGIGVVAMKALRGMPSSGLQLAYLKKLAGDPAISSVLMSFGSYEEFETCRKVLHESLTAREQDALEAHSVANRANNCMMCDACKRACPRAVEISTILRCHDYYYRQKGDRDTALAAYREIQPEKLGGSRCGACRQCEAACPNGIPIIERLRAAHAAFARLA
jgi:predicted aldo/keto reductase-like oxidoreductase